MALDVLDYATKVILVFAFIPPAAIAQFADDCSDAPNEAVRQTCLRLRQNDQRARQNFQQQVRAQPVWPPDMPGSPVWQQPIPVPWNSRGQVAWHPYDCMTIMCLCPFFGGRAAPDGNCILGSGYPLAMAYRKEYRMMTDDERYRFHYAMNVLKRNGEYDRLSREHRSIGEGSGAHSGPGFLTWHREFLKRVEIALRLVDPSVAIPYWDSVIDNYLPDPRDSVIFSEDFLGQVDPNGFVITGPFAYWPTLEGRPYIWRNTGTEGQLFTEQQLQAVLAQTNVEYILAYTVPGPGCPYPPNYQALEYTHSNIHLYVGGDLREPITSANDPTFYVHHSFVDLIFEIWRQTRQPRWAREDAYTPELGQCASPLHFGFSRMSPFNLINRDGLSNAYTDQMYRYAPRPGCSVSMPTCGSRFLFCDLRGFPHCVTKIKLGGICRGYEGMDACFMGQCIFGRCIPGPTPAPWRPVITAPPPMPAPPTPPRPRPNVQMFVDCFNRNPCCDEWAKAGECRTNAPYMREFCRASCAICNPAYNATNECSNRHVSCQQWVSQGQCNGNSRLFLHENCRQGCGLCNLKKADSCRRRPGPTPPAARGAKTARTAAPPKKQVQPARSRISPPPKKQIQPARTRKQRAPKT